MPKIISVCGQKGGCSKSVVARALAVEMAGRGFSVVLADCDLGQRTASEWAKARLHNLYQPPVDVELVDVSETSLAEFDSDVVVADCPGWSDSNTLAVAMISDLLVLPTGPSADDLRPLVRLVHELHAAGMPSDRVVIVLSRFHSKSEEDAARSYLKSAGIEAVPFRIDETATYAKCSSIGLAITEAKAGDTGANARLVMNGIIERLEAVGPRPDRQTNELTYDLSWM